MTIAPQTIVRLTVTVDVDVSLPSDQLPDLLNRIIDGDMLAAVPVGSAVASAIYDGDFEKLNPRITTVGVESQKRNGAGWFGPEGSGPG